MQDFADFVVGLAWDRKEQAFDVSLRFEVPGTGIDDWQHSPEPLYLDLDRLDGLRADEPAYAAALTEMIMRPSDVEEFYLKARAWSEGSKADLHLRLHIDAPARLHGLRWESLRDRTSGTPIATRDNVLFSRYLTSTDWRAVAARPTRRQKALIVIAGPSDVDRYHAFENGPPLGQVNVDDEFRRAREALAGFDLSELGKDEPATLVNLLARLEDEVDVLYLVCHGLLEEDVPRLLLQTSDGRGDAVDGRRLVERLSELDSRPVLAVLSSCQSAGSAEEAASEDEGALSALGPRLAGAGVAAVVAMQGNVTMETASIFAPAFFGAFARDGVVDRAMAVARRALAAADRPDWWVPVLFSRLRSGRTYYRPAFAEQAEKSWQNIELMIRAMTLTPVLGPGLADGILGSRQDIARRWVRRWQMPIAAHNQADLAQVAQYLRVSLAPGAVRAALMDHLRTELVERHNAAEPDSPYHLPEHLRSGQNPVAAIREIGRRQRETDPGEPYRVLAAIPAPVYITTGWTDLLQDALEASEPKRTPTTLAFPWNAHYGVRQPELLDPPTVERPLVYHLFGRVDDPRSLVLTEDDYFAWLKAWIARRGDLPGVVMTALTSQSLMFLGYRLDDWDFRVVFQSIKTFEGSAVLLDNMHAGVQLSPENEAIEPEAAQEYLESYFGPDGISIYWGDTRDFLDELRKRTGLDT